MGHIVQKLDDDWPAVKALLRTSKMMKLYIMIARVQHLNNKTLMAKINGPTNVAEGESPLTMAIWNNEFLRRLELDDPGFKKDDFAGIEMINIPEGLVHLRARTFVGCNNLKFILQTSLETIGDRAFVHCSRLPKIKFPKSLKTIGRFAFSSCHDLKKIELCHTIITSIPDGAFANCSKLTTIEFPASLKMIGERAFEYCSKLTTIEFPESLESIGERAFQNCSNLKNIDMTQTTITSILPLTFDKCSNLTTIVFPESLVSIGTWAFGKCSNLTTIVFPESLESIGNGAFAYCEGLTTIVFPESLKSIGTWAFENCSNLTKIDLHHTQIRSIERDAFLDSNLQEVVLPTNQVHIKHEAFDGHVCVRYSEC